MWPFGNRPLTPSTQKIRDPLNSNIEQVEQQFNPESDEENRLSTSNPSESTITQSTDFELEQLRELAASLKFTKKPESLHRQDVVEFLVKPARRILLQGTIQMETKSRLLMSKKTMQLSPKRAYLLTDVLLVLEPYQKSKFRVDHWIELIHARIHKSELETDIIANNGNSNARPVSMAFSFGLADSKQTHEPPPLACIEIMWPSGYIKLLYKTVQDCEIWYDAILTACTSASGLDSRYHIDASSSEQTSLPVLHKAVLSRNERKLKTALTNITSGKSTESIDEIDNHGYTALHYTCIYRWHSLMEAICVANVDVCLLDLQGLSPLHWSALQLDSHALSILLKNRGESIDPNVRCKIEPRTPLIIACSEGFDIKGEYNGSALADCLKVLLVHNADPDLCDADDVAPLHHLASGWKWEGIREFVVNYKISGINAYKFSGSRGCTALHHAMQAVSRDKHPIRELLHQARHVLGSHQHITATEFMAAAALSLVGFNNSNSTPSHSRIADSPFTPVNSPVAIDSAVVDELSPKDVDATLKEAKLNTPRNYLHGVRTLRALLRSGCRPNSRNMVGKTPLQLIFQHMHQWGRVREAVCVLLMYGARPTAEMIDPAEFNILKEKCCKEINNPITKSRNSTNLRHSKQGHRHDIDRDSIDETRSEHSTTSSIVEDNCIDDDDEWALITNDMTPEKAVEYWKKRTDTGINVEFVNLGYHSLEGNEDVTMCYPLDGKAKCYLCSAVFGFWSSKHHCRICHSLCCNDCLSKKMIVKTKRDRVCDSCFNLASILLEFYQQADSGVTQSIKNATDRTAILNSLTAEISESNTANPNAVHEQEQHNLLISRNSKLPPTHHNSLDQRVQSTNLSEAFRNLGNQVQKYETMAEQAESVNAGAEEFASASKKLLEQTKLRYSGSVF